MLKDNWKTKLSSDPIPWLLESNFWTTYRTLIDLVELPANSPEMINSRKKILHEPAVQQLISETCQWFPETYTRHNNPKISHYKLRMLADFGLTLEDDGLAAIAQKAREHIENGLFAFKQELPQKGKNPPKPNPDSNCWHALPCDSPLITYALLRLGNRTPEVNHSIEIITEKWQHPPGWFCHFFFVEGMFKKLQVGCPMAGLMALEVFSQIPELKESDYARNAYAPLRFHREYGKSLYFFGRSTKFWTLKYPFVWYNALYLAEVLTRFSFLKEEPPVKELIDWIEKSQDESGRFKPTSIYLNYQGWDFANKKSPSPWMTFLCCNILKRYYDQ